MKCAVVHKRSSPNLKTNELDPVSSGSFQTNFSEVIFFSLHEANVFASIFNVNDKDNAMTNFPGLSDYNLSKKFI